MRSLLLWVVVLACLLSGCGGENYTTSKVGVVTVKIALPANARFDTYTGLITKDDGRVGGYRHIHTSTDSAGVKRECIFETADSLSSAVLTTQFTINGQGYGSIAAGDSIVIDGDKVTVNGKAREAAPEPISN